MVYRSVLPAMAARGDWRPNLGYSRPAMAKACVRSSVFFQQVADELGEWWVRLAQDSGAAGAGIRQLERRHLEDAATELATIVSGLPAPVRSVVLRRSAGHSWRKIAADLPDRAYFSILDDWQSALALVWDRYGDLVRRVV